MNAATPVTILGGYLGSGKTTLVNHLLKHADGLRMAIMVNDFGDLPIDASLIETTEEDIINLSGGCVCCSYGNDLTMALLQLGSHPSKPEHIVIEASGVALPGAIAGSLSLLADFEFNGCVVLADAHSIKTQSTERYISDTITRQLSDADIIVVNKVDQLDKSNLDALINWLETDYPDRPILKTIEAQVDNDVVLGIHSARTVETSGDVKHDTSGFKSVEIELSGPIDVAKLTEQLTCAEYKLIRAKGFATDLNGERKTIQIVGTRQRVTTAPPTSTDGIVCIGKSEDMLEFKENFQNSIVN